MSGCSSRVRTDIEEAPLVVARWGRQWTREELVAHADRLEQVAASRLAEGGDGAGRGVRLLRCTTVAGFEILAGPGLGSGGAWIGCQPRDLVQAAA